MQSGTVKIVSRPLRFAFLVNPEDEEEILKAIQINTFLWGRMYNPIIPLFNEIPEEYEMIPGILTPQSLACGYIEAFDPDFIVLFKDDKLEKFDIGNRKILQYSEILHGAATEGFPNCGVGLFELLNYWIDSEFKYIRREPETFRIPEFDDSNKMFCSSVFGILNSKLDGIIKESYDKRLSISREQCSYENYIDFLKSDNVFLRRLSSMHINKRTGITNSCLYFFNAENIIDIIDYWNLRALGWEVLPIPKQSFSYDNIIAFATNYVIDYSGFNRYNPNLFIPANLLKGQGISQIELDKFVGNLKITVHPKHTGNRFYLQRWYPRIWDEQMQERDEATPCRIEADSVEHDVPNVNNRIRLKSLDPLFLKKLSNGWSRKAFYVNEIDIDVFGSSSDVFAEVIPECDRHLVTAFSGMDFSRWRFSKKGIHYIIKRRETHIYFESPKAENVFFSWLRSKGCESKFSDKGYIANQMVKCLGGLWGISSIRNKRLLELFKEMSTGKVIESTNFLKKIEGIAKLEEINIDPQRILQYLTDQGMFKLGIKIQCQICRQHSFYTLDKIGYELECPKCLNQFRFPSIETEKKAIWSYVSHGPFSLPDQAYGTYSVLLTINFFKHIVEGKITPLFSFISNVNGKDIEVDLGLFHRKHFSEDGSYHHIFAECKSKNNLKKDDFNKMEIIGKQFPESVLVFSTLKDRLRSSEIKGISRLVKNSRENWARHQPYNKILILTATELFTDFSLVESWKNASEEHKGLADYSVTDNLTELCEATQRIYLGIEHKHQWLEKRKQT